MPLLAGDRPVNSTEPQIVCRNLVVEFRARGQRVRALDGVSLSIAPGESVGIVGGSGSGKTTLARVLVGLVRPINGEVLVEGKSVDEWLKTDNKRFRRQIQMIFQDPYGSLNPRLTVRQSLREVLRVHRLATREEEESRVRDLLGRVGMDPAFADRYPFQLSGGQRQRIGIARALAVEPSVLIADEPVSALDVSVQANVLNLLSDLQQDGSLTLLLVSHDLAAVRYVCRRVVVMQNGRIVEEGMTPEVFENPRHPYTRALLAAVPELPSPRSRNARAQ